MIYSELCEEGKKLMDALGGPFPKSIDVHPLELMANDDWYAHLSYCKTCQLALAIIPPELYP